MPQSIIEGIHGKLKQDHRGCCLLAILYAHAKLAIHPAQDHLPRGCCDYISPMSYNNQANPSQILPQAI